MLTTNIDLWETLEISISSMVIVFLVLIILMGIVSLFRFIPSEHRFTHKYDKKRRRKYIPFEEMDDDMKAAVLVATIEAKQNNDKDVELKSVRKL